MNTLRNGTTWGRIMPVLLAFSLLAVVVGAPSAASYGPNAGEDAGASGWIQQGPLSLSPFAEIIPPVDVGGLEKGEEGPAELVHPFCEDAGLCSTPRLSQLFPLPVGSRPGRHLNRLALWRNFRL